MKKFSDLSKADEKRALELHRRSIVINALDCTALTYFNNEYFVKLKKGGTTAINLTLIDPATTQYDDYLRVGRNIAFLYDVLEDNPHVLLATQVEDIMKAKKADKVAVIFGLQNASPIGKDLGLLRILHRLGVRIVGLTYQRRNLLGDGCGEKKDCGLSLFGEEVVKEINRLGIVICLAHSGYKTFMDALELSKEPVLFTHGAVRSICDHARNLTDDQIQALADKGGVMGIAPKSWWLKPQSPATIEDYLDQIDYVAKLVGVDHVGIGTDVSEAQPKAFYDMLERLYPEYQSYTKGLTYETLHPPELVEIVKGKHSGALLIPNITKGLVARGYSDEEIEKILGGNFIRIFKRIWK